MSSTNTVTQYLIGIGIGNSGGNITLNASDGVTDAMALDVVTRLQNVAWPTGIFLNITISKVTDVNTSSSGSPNLNPTVFL